MHGASIASDGLVVNLMWTLNALLSCNDQFAFKRLYILRQTPAGDQTCARCDLILPWLMATLDFQLHEQLGVV